MDMNIIGIWLPVLLLLIYNMKIIKAMEEKKSLSSTATAEVPKKAVTWRYVSLASRGNLMHVILNMGNVLIL